MPKGYVPDWKIDLCIVFGYDCDMTLVLLTGGDRTLEAGKGRSYLAVAYYETRLFLEDMIPIRTYEARLEDITV